ncbi:hypothetical protein TNCV_2073141 [Trichonephila clavipes]|uniref:Uncharacterized protein n=1 Tax=Trichonephila clavipes TaxID=2585209 RepID=A0A8X6US61_TRICX|nr:hypothetical protein TNCV_2073141 [Trichonephila clavipes]
MTIGDGPRNFELRTGSQRPSVSSSPEDRNVTRMTLMDYVATSRALNQELEYFARRQMSARLLRQYGLSARRPWMWLFLTLLRRQERLQWYI